MLLACSLSQAQRLLDHTVEVLGATGLRVEATKCCYMRSAGLPPGTIALNGQALVFLGVLIGFHVTCMQTLSRRLLKASAAYHAHYVLLARATGDLKKRLQLFTTFVTSRWRWMSCAVRPMQAVFKCLDTLQTIYLLSMANLPPDPFLSGVSNWISRRRAVRMIAQICGIPRWSFIQLVMFFRLWGHVARLTPGGESPTSSVMRIRGPAWQVRNAGVVRRLPSNWPDSVRLLQLRWESLLARMGLRQPRTWVRMAQNRENWTAWTNLIAAEIASSGKWYASLTSVDLQDRQLVKRGCHF